MNPSPAASALIREHITDWSPSDQAISDLCNAPTIANPTPQGTVPADFQCSTLLGLLSTQSVANLLDMPAFASTIQPIFDAPNPKTAEQISQATGWIQGAAKGGKITVDEMTATLAVVTATKPDPSWQAQLGWAEVTLGRPTDADDIAASRPGV